MTYDSSYDYWANKTCTTDLICLTTRFWLLMIANVNGWSWHYSVSLWLWIVLLLHCTHPVLYEEPCVHMFTNSIIQSATGHSHTNIGQELHLKFTSHIRISVTLTMAWLWAPEMLLSIFLKRMVSWDFYPQKGLHRMMQKKNHTKTSIEPQFCRQKLLFYQRGQRRLAWHVGADRISGKPHLTTAVSRKTSRSWPHVEHWSGCQPRTYRLQRAQAWRNWTVEDWKNVA